MIGRYVDALIQEIELRPVLENFSLETIYFGGGTPSLLGVENIQRIIHAIETKYSLSKVLECTLEANPDDLSESFLEGLKTTLVNRLSIGIQSFHQDDLEYLNRSHNGEEALACIKRAQKYGFDNLTIDLIYGIPISNTRKWQENLDLVEKLNISHLSAYCLTVEAQTPMAYKISKNQMLPVDEEMAYGQFKMLQEFTHLTGLIQYEVSNFARIGHESKHNSNYWNGTPYVAFGPAAHGFVNGDRYWNVSNLKKYEVSIQSNLLPQEIEHLTDQDRYNERLMTGLRTLKGVDFDVLRKSFPSEWINQSLHAAQPYLVDRLAIFDAVTQNLSLTPDGFWQADGIASELFRIEEE